MPKLYIPFCLACVDFNYLTAGLSDWTEVSEKKWRGVGFEGGTLFQYCRRAGTASYQEIWSDICSQMHFALDKMPV